MSGALRQGEILSDIWIHRPLHPPIEKTEGSPIDIRSYHHPLMVVMSPDCDLDHDFPVRFPDLQAQEQYQSVTEDESLPAIIPQVLLGDLYKEDEIRSRIQGADIWRRIKQNQDERYHCFESASIGNPSRGELPALYLDFKKSLSLPTPSLYDGLRVNGVQRIALIPPIYIHHLIHRFYGFLSRVGLP
jgi:hypothetical protein